MKNDAQFGAEIRGHHSLTRLIVLYFGVARGIFVSTRPKSGATQYRMKVVFAIDSFKGSMSSLEAADAAEKGLLKVFETAQAVKIPVADGGEGTVEALAAQEGARLVEIEAADRIYARRILRKKFHYSLPLFIVFHGANISLGFVHDIVIERFNGAYVFSVYRHRIAVFVNLFAKRTYSAVNFYGAVLN